MAEAWSKKTEEAKKVEPSVVLEFSYVLSGSDGMETESMDQSGSWTVTLPASLAGIENGLEPSGGIAAYIAGMIADLGDGEQLAYEWEIAPRFDVYRVDAEWVEADG